MPESKFMKEWKKSYASCSLRVGNEMCGRAVCERLNMLVEIIDKHLIEMKEDIARSFLQETADQRFHRKGTGF